MPKRAAPLYAKQLERWRPDPVLTLERIDGSTPGLRARLGPNGRISWSLSIRVDGVRQRIALGKNLGLAEARKVAEQTRATIARGEDPGGVRRARTARRRAAANGSARSVRSSPPITSRGRALPCGRGPPPAP
jgi:hypothetical protein